jgi:hypothetical protein
VALSALATTMHRRTKTLNDLLRRLESSDIEDKEGLLKVLHNEIKNLDRQRRLLDRERAVLSQKFETLQKQAGEIARVSRQMAAITTLIDIRFGGQG